MSAEAEAWLREEIASTSSEESAMLAVEAL